MEHLKIKTGKFVAAVTLLMLQFMVAFSQTNIQLDLYRPGTEIARLKMESNLNEPVTITVKNATGDILYTEKCTERQYVKMFNFSKAENGTYFIDLVQPRGISRKVVVKDNKQLFFQEDTYSLYNYVKLRDEERKLLVKFNGNFNAPVTIRIEDSEGRVVHEENDIMRDDYTVLFNLSRLMGGTYNMKLISGDYSSSKYFDL